MLASIAKWILGHLVKYIMNTSPPIPPFWDQIKAGCIVETNATDYVSAGYCSESGVRTYPAPALVIFSVGDITNLDNYSMSNGGVLINWSGDCSGSGHQCSVTGSCSGGNCPGLGSVSASVTISYNGLQKIFAVSAYDGTFSSGAGGGGGNNN